MEQALSTHETLAAGYLLFQNCLAKQKKQKKAKDTNESFYYKQQDIMSL